LVEEVKQSATLVYSDRYQSTSSDDREATANTTEFTEQTQALANQIIEERNTNAETIGLETTDDNSEASETEVTGEDGSEVIVDGTNTTPITMGSSSSVQIKGSNFAGITANSGNQISIGGNAVGADIALGDNNILNIKGNATETNLYLNHNNQVNIDGDHSAASEARAVPQISLSYKHDDGTTKELNTSEMTDENPEASEEVATSESAISAESQTDAITTEEEISALQADLANTETEQANVNNQINSGTEENSVLQNRADTLASEARNIEAKLEELV
jgi:hypothetical protein